MIYGSVCSGIEAATVAWHDLGWTPAWFSEIEPFPCKVLKYRYPHVPNLGNMLSLTENKTFNNGKIDLLVGGTPCQSFSVAGLRRGLTDERGNLAIEFCRLLIAKQPQWFVWENVPGALSSFSDPTQQSDEETSDFAAILAAFRECGYCCAWRVLDAQFFGVPQRRRRIFVVGYLGNDWRPPAKVLFERESLFWDIATIEEKRKEIVGTIDARIKGGGFPGSDGAMNGHVIPVLFNYKQTSGGSMNPSSISPTLDKSKTPALFCNAGVRKLTPLECERLQGFPDNYTLIPGASDTVRYQAIGNSMAVPVMRWIGRRIDEVDKLTK